MTAIWTQGLTATQQPAGNLFLDDPWLEAYAVHQPAGAIDVHSLMLSGRRIPFSIAREHVRGISVRVLRILGDPLADQCWFGGPDAFDLSAVVAHLPHGPRWDIAILSELCAESDQRNAFDAAARAAGLRAVWRISGKAPVVKFATLSKPLQTSDYSPTLRKRLKRARKKLEDVGKISLHHAVPEPEDVDGLLETIKSIEDASWKGDAGTGLFNTVRLPFIRDLSHRLARLGQLEIFILELDNTPITYRYGFRYGGRFLDYNLAYLKDFSALSPGRVLLDEIVRFAQAGRLEAVDASRGSIDRPHILADWPCEIREHHRLTLYAPRPAGRLLYFIEARLRPVVLKLRKT